MTYNNDGPIYSSLTGKGDFALWSDTEGEGGVTGACNDTSWNPVPTGPNITIIGYYATAFACCSACNGLNFEGGCIGECN